MKKTRRKLNKSQSLYYDFDSYQKLITNQMILQTTIQNLFKGLREPDKIDNLKEYLGFDNHFDIELCLDNAIIDYSLVDNDAEACIYINMKITYDKQDISKGEQLFFFLCNGNVELDVI